MEKLNAKLLLKKIEFYEQNKLIEEGIEECENLISLKPNSVHALYYLGIFLMHKEKFRYSITLLQTINDILYKKD